MKRMILYLTIISAALYGFADKDTRLDEVDLLVDNVFNLSKVMLHDVANPPVASRNYAYSLLGAYEVLVASGDLQDISGKFVENPGFKRDLFPSGLSSSFCAIYAMLEVGKEIMPSGYMLKENQQILASTYKKANKWSEKVLNQNVAFAVKTAQKVLRYAKSDGYNSLSTFTRYTPSGKPGGWYPTPPAYLEPVEPNWNTIRPFFLTSADQFKPVSPVPYSDDRNSDFFSALKEVYEVTNELTSEQQEIAAFWDCNPFAVEFSGHVMIGLKKISPGGHWIGITGIASQQSNISFKRAVLVHTYVALTLHDAFISCWDEKYRSDRIRPETAINKLIDKDWRPLLQTPPFPEYTSGHSVISTASAEMLTYLFGDNYKFTDTSEEYFGLEPRTFGSFRQACNEAAISRLYGGIHYRDACEDGQDQGRDLGKYIVSVLSEAGNP
ncbi:MAG: vanadium-dependent haloperoxidase [Cyclobacteriaceae bacterium]